MQKYLPLHKNQGRCHTVCCRVYCLCFLSCQFKGQGCLNCPDEMTSLREDTMRMYSPSTLIILYDKGIGKKPLLKAMKRIKADLRYEYKMMSGIAIRKPADKTIEETMAYFKKVKGVVSVMRDGVNYLH